MDVLQPVDERLARTTDSDGPMTTSTPRSTIAHAAALVAVATSLAVISASPADAHRPDDGRQSVVRTPVSNDIDLVVAFRKSAAAQYAVDHAAELARNR
jgi:hypothetical protein